MKIRIPTDTEYLKLCDITNENDALMHWENMGSWVDDVELSPLSTFRAYRGCLSARYYRSVPAYFRGTAVGFRPVVEGINTDALPSDNGLVVLGTLYMNGKPVKAPKTPIWTGDIAKYIPDAVLEMRAPLNDTDYQVKGFILGDGVAIADRVLLERISYKDIEQAT